MASLGDFLDSGDEYDEEPQYQQEEEEREEETDVNIGDSSEVSRKNLLKAVGITKVSKKQQAYEISKQLEQKRLKKQQDDEKVQRFGKKSLKDLSQPSDFYRESNVGIPQAFVDDLNGNDDDSNTVSFRDLATTLIGSNTTLKKKLKESINKGNGRLLEKPEDPVALARKNRIEGYKTTNKKMTTTWSSTIKANLTAEHLHFPLNKESVVTSTETFAGKPDKKQQQSELESDIQKVLIGSGASKDAVARYEAQLRAEAEEARRNRRKGSEEEEERRMGLQMYYQQLKARRRAKIKSKSFRKIERQRKAELKEMEMAEMLENDPEAALDLEVKADRDRILERATLRHKADSKWAKKAKVKGLSKVPEIKRVLAEKARIGNELTRKMSSVSSGLTSENGNPDTYDLDSDNDVAMGGNNGNEEDINVFAEDNENNNDAEMDDYETGALIDAEREEREMDDEERVQEVLRESAAKGAKVSAPVFAGKSVVLSSTAGGRKVNVSGNVTIANTNLFKEVGFADIQDDIDSDIAKNAQTVATVTTADLASNVADVAASTKSKKGAEKEKEANPWLHVPAGSGTLAASKKAAKSKKEEGEDDDENVNKIVDGDDDDDDDDVNDRRGLDLISASEDQRRLVREAFAADESDTELELEREKEEEIEELAGVGKRDTDVLPGWGSWTGEGVVESQRAKERRLRREREEEERRKAVMEKVRIIRKDADLKHVIINEKVDKKAAIYKARAVPMGTTQDHYERMLAIPVGREWQTSIAHRKMIVPKITVEKGKVLKPLLTPKKVSTAGRKKNSLKKTTKN